MTAPVAGQAVPARPASVPDPLTISALYRAVDSASPTIRAVRASALAAAARVLAPAVPILSRTHYVKQVDELAQAGASQVVAEEVESTLQLLMEALRRLGVPEEAAARFAGSLRDEGYVFLRTPEAILDPWLSELLESVTTHWVDLPPGFTGPRSLADLDVRARTGANVLAVERAGAVESNPPAGFALRAGDRLLVLGAPEAIERLSALLGAAPERP